MNDERNLEDSEQARDEALAAVAARSKQWMKDAIAYVKDVFLPGEEVTGEDIRFEIRSAVGEPNHHNAYGALVNSLRRSGVLVPAGRTAPMRAKSSHARKTPVYTVVAAA